MADRPPKLKPRYSKSPLLPMGKISSKIALFSECFSLKSSQYLDTFYSVLSLSSIKAV